jgi:NAD+ synthase
MFTPDALNIHAEAVTSRIAESIRQVVLGDFRRKGAVLGVSGGIDSAVVAALCSRALGKDRVLALLMPERHSSDDATRLGKLLTDTLGIETATVEISGILEAAGCYSAQDEAIRTAVPEYGPGWRCKLVLPSILDSDRLNLTRLTVQPPAGTQQTVRLSHRAYLQMVAATNYKQRVRKMTEYYHADRMNYAVAGTPNRLEYDQGFFVKQGDGAADFKPIAHLYKTQVYALARYLGVPEEICARA